MKTQFLSLITIGLLTVLLSCQQEEVASTNQQIKSRGARYASAPYNVAFDIGADEFAGTGGNCRNFYASKRADGSHKSLITVTVNNFDGVSKTFAIEGYGSSSSYEAVSLSGGYTTSRSNGYNWVIPAGSASYTLKFYANFGPSTVSGETIWTVSLTSPYSVPANGCGDGTGDAINVVKKVI